MVIAKTGKGPNKTQMVRDALTYLGIDATTSAIRDWLASEHPKVEFNKNTLSPTISTLRKELRGQSATPSVTVKKKPASERSTNNGEAVKVARPVASEDTPSALIRRSILDELNQLANRVGGLEKLRELVEVLSQ